MKICAVICEFNPFHSGHKYLIQQIKAMGYTHIVAIMSGNYVQRGEPAVISKKARVEIALNYGIDLVIELPTVWAVSCAQIYAEAGIGLANSLGCVDTLAFGSECGNINTLLKISDAVNSPEFSPYLKKYLESGITFAKARELAIEAIYPSDNLSKIFDGGNNNLGIEYLNALKKSSSKIKPITIKRDSDNYLPALQIRKLIKENDKNLKKYLPQISYNIILDEIKKSTAPADLYNAEKPILSHLRNISKESLLNCPDVNEGIENKIISSAELHGNLEKVLSEIKSKRYTMARIKRIILNSYLGITEKIQKSPLPYIRILGMTNQGLEILKTAKQTAKLPVVSEYSQIKKLDCKSQEIFQKECTCSNLYSMFLNSPLPGGDEQKFKIIRR